MNGEWVERDGQAVIMVRGLPSSALGEVRAYAAHESSRSISVAGEWAQAPEGLFFTPRFPPLEGTGYVVVSGDESIVVAAPARVLESTTQVRAVYPSGAAVPRNLLRFYVHFSDRMSEGFAAEHVHVHSAATGQILPDVLLAMDPELWDPSRRRLTVLLDPGRIKRGLVPHQEGGYPLTEGSDIRVVIDDGFLDAQGRRLVGDHSRTYEVGHDQRGRVDVDGWTFNSPAVGTREPLVARFDRPLDRGLLGRCLAVAGIDGESEVGPGEWWWSFTPADSWSAPSVCLWVDPILEDAAGNSVARVFDRDLADPIDDPGPAEPIAIAIALTEA